jgi:LysM repeat protein
MSKLLKDEVDHKVIEVEEGDTLYSIAKNELGNGKRWGELAMENPGDDLAKHAYVRSGTKLVVPKDFKPSQQ